MYVKRQLLGDLKSHLERPELSLILGPRQAGKTTLILKLKDDLEKEGQKTAYFDLDRLEDAALFRTQDTFVERLRFDYGANKVFVFIDEIQRLPNAGLFLKGLYDFRSPHKFIVTGSGSLELKESIVEPLTGRKKIFYLYPLSFKEFFEYKTSVVLDQFDNYYQTHREEALRLLDEYLVFGGYPKVVLEKTRGEKEEALRELFVSYLEKDVKALLGVEKDFAYQNLLKYLASEVGTLFKKSEVSRNLGLNIKTLNRYLFLLDKTFVTKMISPFYKNPTKELTKTPKIYFIDLGLRNFVCGNLNSFFQREDKGKLFENFVFRQLLDSQPQFGVWFWSTSPGAEVDFVLNEKEILPIEAKAGEQRIGVVGKSLLSFMEKYKVSKGIIVHWGENKSLTKLEKRFEYKRLLYN